MKRKLTIVLHVFVDVVLSRKDLVHRSQEGLQEITD